jgi:hypothetical protein
MESAFPDKFVVSCLTHHFGHYLLIKGKHLSAIRNLEISFFSRSKKKRKSDRPQLAHHQCIMAYIGLPLSSFQPRIRYLQPSEPLSSNYTSIVCRSGVELWEIVLGRVPSSSRVGDKNQTGGIRNAQSLSMFTAVSPTAWSGRAMEAEPEGFGRCGWWHGISLLQHARRPVGAAGTIHVVVVHGGGGGGADGVSHRALAAG